jgi:tyrosyl-tRNA synthetase
LAARVVEDFHSVAAATKAAEDWAQQFQKGGVPEEVEQVEVPETSMRIDKLLARVGLADSVSDAVRKLKQGAVKINGAALADPARTVELSSELILQAGRKIKKVRGGTAKAG